MKFFITILSMIVTGFIIFCVIDISRFLYNKFKLLVISVYNIRKERKQKKSKKENIESTLSTTEKQYEYLYHEIGE